MVAHGTPSVVNSLPIDVSQSRKWASTASAAAFQIPSASGLKPSVAANRRGGGWPSRSPPPQSTRGSSHDFFSGTGGLGGRRLSASHGLAARQFGQPQGHGLTATLCRVAVIAVRPVAIAFVAGAIAAAIALADAAVAAAMVAAGVRWAVRGLTTATSTAAAATITATATDSTTTATSTATATAASSATAGLSARGSATTAASTATSRLPARGSASTACGASATGIAAGAGTSLTGECRPAG